MQVIVVALGPAESPLSYNTMGFAQTTDKLQLKLPFIDSIPVSSAIKVAIISYIKPPDHKTRVKRTMSMNSMKHVERLSGQKASCPVD